VSHGSKRSPGHLWEAAWAAPINDLIGARIKFYDTLSMANVATVKAGTQTHAWSTWGDVLALSEHSDAKVLATYADQYYAGEAAAITRSLGKGTVTYVGVDSLSGSLEAQLIREVYARAKVKTDDLPEGFVVDWRDGLWIAMNSTDKVQHAPIPANGRMIIGQRDIPITGVTVWKDQ